ncbi:MAG: hypothetical protein LBT55_04785, partial [Clostridiaceae bacterium]|nr:hypothetical protein [Clostridiaceae bacterium]
GDLTEKEKEAHILSRENGGNGIKSSVADDKSSDVGNEKCPATTDYVFLLNSAAAAGLYFEKDGETADGKYYLNPSRQAIGTEYAVGRNLYQSKGVLRGNTYAEIKGKSWWWLRNRGGGGGRFAACVSGLGSIDDDCDYDSVSRGSPGVRPCVRVRF